MSDGPTPSGERWSRRKLAVVLFPFVTAAVAINLYLAFLLGASVGLPVLSPVWALVASVPLGVPASYAAAAWVDRLLDETEQ